ncbi:MAG TPA: hypothetical protein VGL10_07260 [Gammaproteobacteria bacterium]
MSMLKAYSLTGDDRFSRTAVRAAEYLMSLEARPMGASFFCRKNPYKDYANGLIGQAWVLEALSAAADLLVRSQYRTLVEEVFFLHPYEENVGLWGRVNVDGSYRPIDWTLNQQAWFAASVGSGHKNDPLIEQRILKFLDLTDAQYLSLGAYGRIRHRATGSRIGETLRSIRKIAKSPLNYLEGKRDMFGREIGYHAFNLYGFSLLKHRFPQHALWKNPKFIKALRFLQHDRYIDALDKSKYAYSYNPCGFEAAYAIETFPEVFPDHDKLRRFFINRQIARTFNFKTCLMELNSVDPITLAARLYEITRLSDMEIETRI